MPKHTLVLFFLLLGACEPLAQRTPLTPVTVQLSFLHQAEFAGLYAADQQGYFAAEGLAVPFLAGGLQVDFIASVVNGTAQYLISIFEMRCNHATEFGRTGSAR